MSNFVDLTGKRFGFLTVLRSIAVPYGERTKWICSCECGKKKEVLGYNIKNGHTRSCGCLKSKHGHCSADVGYRSPVYTTWLSMIQRCTNSNHKHYHRYGGRGIIVCERWNKFKNFLIDMGERPDGRQLDRMNNNDGYSPDNCRWVTSKDQGRNRNNNRIITHNGITQCLTAWAEDLDVAMGTLRYRLANWSIEEALTKLLHDGSSRKIMYDFYLAGGMRGYKDQNRPMFTKVTRLLRQKGHTVWSPAESEGTVALKSFADCMSLDLNAIINSCKGIALLPGWRDSLGANIEAIVSFSIGNRACEVIFDEDEIAIELSPIDLSGYSLPYKDVETRSFNPHECGLNSFASSEK